MTNPKAYHMVCRFCRQAFTTVRELDEHVIIFHLSVKRETGKDDISGIEPADNKQTTEHPPADKGVKPR